MKKYTVYEIETGHIISTNDCPNSQLPPQGPIDGRADIAIRHGASNPNGEKVENGKVVPLGLQDRRKSERRDGWFEMRRLRNQKLTETDFKMNGDYPLSKDEKRRLKRQRQQSRDLTKATKDPREAKRLLEQIWSNEDVE